MIIGAASIALLALAVPPATDVERHVIIVGVNDSVDDGVAPLSFADDDAARYAELLGRGAASLALLAVLDVDAQARFPDAAAHAVPPSRAAVDEAVHRAFAAIAAARQAQREADLLFIYAGHGGVDGSGEGYVSLLDGRFTRTDLFSTVISVSPARFNHIIVDACSAYHLLNRGADASTSVRALLSLSTLAQYPNTGALLATSRDQATHEWTRIESGVFSYQVLSALAGAADVDGDDTFSYAEVGAFVEAANAGVRDRRARIDLWLQPPRALVARPLWQRGDRTGTTLALSAHETGRFAVVDGRGVSIVELNKNGEQPLLLTLVGPAPFTVYAANRELQALSALTSLNLADLSPAKDSLQARSSLDDALVRGLFTLPFGRSYVEGYRSRLDRESSSEFAHADVVDRVPGPSWRSGVVATATVAAVVLGAGSVGAGAVALERLAKLEAGRERITAFEAQEIADHANVALVVAGATAIAGAALGLGAAALVSSE